MMNPYSLEGQRAFITGGGSGLGLAIAQAMAAAGAEVVIAGRRREVLDEAVAKIGASARGAVLDITDFDATAAAVARIEQEAGPIDLLVNNAGIHVKKPATETSVTELEAVLRTHVTSAHHLVGLLAPGMVERRSGCILFIASMAALMGLPRVVAYSAAKSACVGMVRSLASELSPLGVRVNAIAPGWIDTPMLWQALDGDEARQRKILGRTPMNRYGEPGDVGHAAVYLCSPAAKFVTGVVLPVDGGASIGF